MRSDCFLTLSAALVLALAVSPVWAQSEDEDSPEAPTWDVQAWPSATRTQQIDTTEGTWMSVDVSPDGETIAFDLLGDIYLMPIEGGKARNLTSGVAWDMQPRFSPDGETVAFTSDRTGKNGKGGDNIWTIDVDGDPESLTQITQETFRLLNGAAWSPDGEYIVARKHFTSRRSLGAGEMWMHHRSGVEGGATGGLQLTDRPTDQKDVNEPVFSPDGKYLYYSEDATPGQTFEYGKDSTKQIYVINRLDLETGESERYITGPGGACRPTPSPDGKTIAFVRRHEGRSALHLFETGSGRVTMLHDDLERDMQEAWAIHGVYPTMAWTPDGESIVFWARGQIRRIDVETGEFRTIPFHVTDERAIAEALRFPVEVAPDEFDVRVLRWVQTSPDGRHALYQALGKIYLKEIGSDARPRRLTTQDSHFEISPRYSRDGRHVVYATWDDEELGAIRVVSVDGREQWTVTSEKGHYIDPAFTPDGKTIVASKIGGGWLRSPLWSREQGVYAWPARGGEATLVTRDGSKPMFGADSDRVFLVRSAPEKDADNTKLISIGLDGNEERTHFTSAWGTDYAVSPDGAWIALIERHKVHLAPFVHTGRTISVGPDASNLPLRTVSRQAGEWVHFGADSDTLHWALGPNLYSQDLETAMADFNGSGEDSDAEPRVTHIGFAAAHDKPEGTIALVGGRIVTMRDGTDEIIDDGVIVVEDNRIVSVGSRGDVRIPRGAERIDVSGRTILPGFVDTHAHGAQATSGIHPQQNWVDLARLAFGVTTIHDPSNDTNSIFGAAELAKAGEIVAPRTFSTGTILYGAAGHYHADIDSLDDARFHLKRMKDIGAISVKSYNQPRRDQRQQVIDAARELEMMVVPEGGSTFMHNMNMIVDGHTGIEHTLPVEIVYDDVLDLWRDTGVGYTPTLSVAYGGIPGENYFYNHDDVWRNPRVASFIPPFFVEPRARRREKAPEEDYNHFLVARITKQRVDEGGLVQAGGHGQLNGLCTHWEMWMFVHGGMTPFEALRSGTLHGAKYVGLDADLGSIEGGKLADLIVLEAGRDPLANIRHSEHIAYTMVNGRLFEAKTMNQMWPERIERAPLFWEQDGFEGLGMTPEVHTGCHGCGAAGMASWMHP